MNTNFNLNYRFQTKPGETVRELFNWILLLHVKIGFYNVFGRKIDKTDLLAMHYQAGGLMHDDTPIPSPCDFGFCSTGLLEVFCHGKLILTGVKLTTKPAPAFFPTNVNTNLN